VGFRAGLLVWFGDLHRRESYPGNVRQQDRVADSSLLRPSAIPTRNNLDSEEIRRLSFIEGKEDLRYEALALDYF
jgi:hypothetical protein